MWQKLCFRPNRHGPEGVGGSNGALTWAGYAAIAVAVHAAILLIPAYHKVATIEPERVIGVLLTKEEPTSPAIRTTRGNTAGKPGLPSRKVPAKTPPPAGPPAPFQQKVKPSGLPRPAEKAAEPQSGAPGNMADRNTVTPLPPSPVQANDEGVGVAGLAGGKGKVGEGSGGSGIGIGTGGTGYGSGGGTGGGGSGTGTGAGTGGGQAVRPLAFLHKVVPEYPASAKRRRKEGRVSLVVWVDEKGTFLKADVVQATSDMFIQPAIEAAKQSTYVPSTKKGPSKGSVSYGFNLEQ